jgi:membrane-associated protein
MDKKKFMFYNIVGSLLWSFVLIFAGHYLYELFLTQFKIDLKHYIEYIVIAIVLMTTIPVLMKLLRKKA